MKDTNKPTISAAEEQTSDTIRLGLQALEQTAHYDAAMHGLYNEYGGPITTADVRCRLAYRIEDEVIEACAACDNEKEYAEELADVVILCASAAGYLGIDLGAAVEAKRAKNKKRPYMHQGEKKEGANNE